MWGGIDENGRLFFCFNFFFLGGGGRLFESLTQLVLNFIVHNILIYLFIVSMPGMPPSKVFKYSETSLNTP